jgi:hypothetical protein
VVAAAGDLVCADRPLAWLDGLDIFAANRRAKTATVAR